MDSRQRTASAVSGHTEDSYSGSEMGFIIQNKHIGFNVVSWFDRQLFKVENYCYVLRGQDPDGAGFVKFDDVLTSIEQLYYTPLNTAAERARLSRSSVRP